MIQHREECVVLLEGFFCFNWLMNQVDGTKEKDIHPASLIIP